jgi:hypothetical protein
MENKETTAQIIKEIIDAYSMNEVFYQQFLIEKGLIAEYIKFMEQKKAGLEKFSIETNN